MKSALRILLLCVFAFIVFLVLLFLSDSSNYHKSEKAIESFFKGKQMMVWQEGVSLRGIERDSLDFREFELIPLDEKSLLHIIKVYQGMEVYLDDPGLPILIGDATFGEYTLRRRSRYKHIPRDTIAFPNGCSVVKYYLYQWKLGVKKTSFWSLEDQ